MDTAAERIQLCGENRESLTVVANVFPVFQDPFCLLGFLIYRLRGQYQPESNIAQLSFRTNTAVALCRTATIRLVIIATSADCPE